VPSVADCLPQSISDEVGGLPVSQACRPKGRFQRVTTHSRSEKLPTSAAVTYPPSAATGQCRKRPYGEQRLFSGSTADTVQDLKVLYEFGVAAVDTNFERLDAESSLA
jgi:hypothetical protein